MKSAAIDMRPTMHLRWEMASDKEEEGPCASNLRCWPEMGSTGYVLKQWWTDDGSRGEWRLIELNDDGSPPNK